MWMHDNNDSKTSVVSLVSPIEDPQRLNTVCSPTKKEYRSPHKWNLWQELTCPFQKVLLTISTMDEELLWSDCPPQHIHGLQETTCFLWQLISKTSQHNPLLNTFDDLLTLFGSVGQTSLGDITHAAD